MNRLSSFSDFSLTRSEMKGVRGGSCYSRGSGSVTKYTGTGAMAAAKNSGTNWCCDGCADASWCYDGSGNYYCS